MFITVLVNVFMATHILNSLTTKPGSWVIQQETLGQSSSKSKVVAQLCKTPACDFLGYDNYAIRALKRIE